MRPVINLKQLNCWVETPHFKMEEISTLQDLGDWILKVNLKDTYFSIPIHQDHQRYLKFMVDGTCYQFTCLPFSLSSMPCTYIKVMNLLRLWDIRIIIYIDDMLIMPNSKVEAVQHLEALVFLLVGFAINREKSLLTPVQ